MYTHNTAVRMLILFMLCVFIPCATSHAQVLIITNQDNFSFEGEQYASDTLIDTLIISHSGDDTLSWNSSWSESWLTVEPSEGTAPCMAEIKVSAENMPGGSYSDMIWLESAEASNSPYIIEVDFNILPLCQGLCGDANGDGDVNVSDAAYIIIFVFIDGSPPIPILACGDANSDANTNISDAVWLIGYVFIGGPAPDDCAPGFWEDSGGDCCPFSR